LPYHNQILGSILSDNKPIRRSGSVSLHLVGRH
jgi:hypothetical protein